LLRGFSLPVHHLNIITTAIHKTNSETLSVTLKEGQRLSLENGVLRRTSEPNSRDVKARGGGGGGGEKTAYRRVTQFAFLTTYY
jgi:hypothetical protein